MSENRTEMLLAAIARAIVSCDVAPGCVDVAVSDNLDVWQAAQAKAKAVLAVIDPVAAGEAVERKEIADKYDWLLDHVAGVFASVSQRQDRSSDFWRSYVEARINGQREIDRILSQRLAALSAERDQLRAELAAVRPGPGGALAPEIVIERGRGVVIINKSLSATRWEYNKDIDLLSSDERNALPPNHEFIDYRHVVNDHSWSRGEAYINIGGDQFDLSDGFWILTDGVNKFFVDDVTFRSLTGLGKAEDQGDHGRG